MLDIGLLFKIAVVGILIVVIDKILKGSGKEEIAVLTNMAGIVIILMLVVNLINKLFNTVRTMFQL
jgi:stage III sporulation protein AC